MLMKKNGEFSDHELERYSRHIILKEIVAQGAQPPILTEKEFVSASDKRDKRTLKNITKTMLKRKLWLIPKYPVRNQAKVINERTATIILFPLTQNHQYF